MSDYEVKGGRIILNHSCGGEINFELMVSSKEFVGNKQTIESKLVGERRYKNIIGTCNTCGEIISLRTNKREINTGNVLLLIVSASQEDFLP